MELDVNLDRQSGGGEFFTPSNRETAAAPLTYRLLRLLLRLWFGMALRRVRLLNSEGRAASGPAILFVHHPASFVDALLLVATLEERVHCFLQGNHLGGIWRHWIARALEIVPFETEGKGWDHAVEDCCDVFLKRGIVVAFEEAQTSARPGKSPQVQRIAYLAAEAESRLGAQVRVNVSPVYLFVPVEHSQSRETMIFLGAPLPVEESLPPGNTGHAPLAQAVAAALARSSRENPFRLHDQDLDLFLRDLEEVLRLDLQEEWAAKQNWKQQVEGFVLGRKVVEWVELVNGLHPGRLVPLREDLEAYREIERRTALETLQVESMPQMKSAVRRAMVWAESILGLPLALYGLINHALIWLALLTTGLLSKDRRGDKVMGWIGRILVALAFYLSQILLCDHLLGRAAAGYYAPSLPLSALYLWRYRWLLQHRTRLAFMKWRSSWRVASSQVRRDRLIEEISKGTAAYSGMREAAP